MNARAIAIYLQSVYGEFRAASFPSRRDIATHTIVVVVSIMLLIAFLTIVDGFFAFLVKVLFTHGR